ncbi:unnamed protein product [Taenia asiatica]|uniref:DUF3480 domain-containing protein n=1 Tax=Taenia asiatica TaxID=60517 RepID=A0A0R3W0F1_TAEAS|nr:unnamed protein product [Taenia asiatica]
MMMQEGEERRGIESTPLQPWSSVSPGISAKYDNQNQIELYANHEQGCGGEAGLGVNHESNFDLVELKGGSSFHEPFIVVDRAVNVLAMGETLMRTLLGRASLMDLLDNHYGLQPMCSSCGDVKWGFNCIFSVRMMDRMIAEEELYIKKRRGYYSGPGAEGEISGPRRAHQCVAWNQLKVIRFDTLLRL